MNTNTTPETTSHTHSDSIESFEERMKSIFNKTKTESDNLRDLYENDPDAYEDEIDEIIDAASDDDAGFIETLKKLKQARGGPDEAQLVLHIKEMRANLRKLILSEAGLPDESRFMQIENAKKQVSEVLRASQESTSTPTDALNVLGILQRNDNEDDMLSFPYDLMPVSVVEKWKTYLGSVILHVRAADNVMKTGDRDAVENADRVRTYAHNSVTDDVHAILGLEGLGGWDRAKTRQLLGNIRDHELPSFESARDARASGIVDESAKQCKITSLLCSQSSQKH